MTPPNLRTVLLGSRFTAPPIMLLCAFITYRWWVDGGQGILGLLMIGLFLASVKAASEVGAYRRWRADWEAMSPHQRPRGLRLRPAPLALLMGIVAVSAGLLLACQPGAPPELHRWMVWIAIVSAALILVRFMRWRWPWGQRERLALVAVAVRGPVVHVPSIQGCYQRLPSYCQQLLEGRS